MHVERFLMKAGYVLFVWFYMRAMIGYGLVHAGNSIDCFGAIVTVCMFGRSHGQQASEKKRATVSDVRRSL